MQETYRNLGRSGLKTSPLWLGTMMFGDQTDHTEAARIVGATRDAGLNAIDTADIYANGQSERIVGELIKTDRSRWVLASKLANPMSAEPNDRGLSRRWLMQACEASLKRLGTDRIDVYYLHRDDESTPMEETLSALAKLIADGKILHWGVSNFRAWRIVRIAELARAMGVPPPIVCQPPYNAMSRGIETELLPACNHYGLGVVAYSPLARGVLTGKYKPDAAPDAGTRAARADKRLMQTEFRAESLALSQRFAAYAEQRGVAASHLAIAWVLNNRLVNGVIGGPRTLEQWNDYLAARTLTLSDEDEAFISGLVPAGHASTHGYTDPLYPVTGRQPRTSA
ncbi:aldo/keto reductase [Aquincola sp. S2]|uniref:Aldo/keto reductase n=1 Tax=Pseudaquabacterium terrae TaxID=2732868 RepID=A0ABX2EUF4_9BURK|nr:aldo/keto reductase [Aquabacterium terrae]NRF72364.1 aldo/keto reductase [Aquabacterium terrae]